MKEAFMNLEKENSTKEIWRDLGDLLDMSQKLSKKVNSNSGKSNGKFISQDGYHLNPKKVKVFSS
jgi:hypothetical protein